MGASAALTAAQRAHDAGVVDDPRGDHVSSPAKQRLREILATLEECQTALLPSGDRDTAQLLSVAIMELRIKLNREDDSELKALCDMMLREANASQTELARRPHNVIDVLTAHTSRARRSAS